MANRGVKKLVIYEPRTEGHHLSWLRMITEDLLKGGFDLTVALDTREEMAAKVKEQLGEVLPRVKAVPVRRSDGKLMGGTHEKTLVQLLNQFQPDQIFLCELDEIASRISRRAAFGLLPPKELRGKIGGIYFRPRFLLEERFSLNNSLKHRGFFRLLKENWFRQVLLVDEYLAKKIKQEHGEAPFHFLPDPVPTGYEGAAEPARRKLGLPLDQTIFLFFGGPYRRKGLHLAVEAFLQGATEGALLLCAGLREKDEALERGIQKLVKAGRAVSIKRYVTTAEERLCYQAADFVLLPYIKHFGASSVLSGAISARKPVIVSDEELLGRLVGDYNLGLKFRSEDTESLSTAIRHALQSTLEERLKWRAGAEKFESNYSRDIYRRNLIQALS